MEKNLEVNKHKDLLSVDLWRERLAEITTHNNWDLEDLLGKSKQDKIETALMFENISELEKPFYAETTARIILGLMNYGQDGSRVIEHTLYEVHKLGDQLGHAPEWGVFFDILSFHLAREANTNTYGAADEFFRSILDRLAIRFIEFSKENSDAIINPFNLKDGDEIFKIDEVTKSIQPFYIEVFIDGARGLVAFGTTKSEQEDLLMFNRKLSLGIYMLRNGDNRFGGIERIKDDTGIERIKEGSVIKVDVTPPFEKEKRIIEVEILSTNQKELEEKYGYSYLAFIDKFPLGQSPLKIKVKLPEGDVLEELDMRELKIVD